MKPWAAATLKLCWGAYLISSSLYCFLAFVPFTYLFVIANPPYAWLNTFARYNLLLLWVCVAGSAMMFWRQRSLRSARAVMAAQLGLALIVSIYNPIGHVRNNPAAFAWGAGLLMSLVIFSAHDLVQYSSADEGQPTHFQVNYRDAVWIGALTGLISCAVLRLHVTLQGGIVLVQGRDLQLMFWVLVEHLTLAIIIASTINLIGRLLSGFARSAALLGFGAIGFITFAGIAFGSASFMESSFSLRAPTAWCYSVLLAAALTVWGLGAVAPVLSPRAQSGANRWLLGSIAVVLIVAASYLPETIGLEDWNGILHVSLTLLLWLVLAVSICRLRQFQKPYSLAMMVIVPLGALGAYETLLRSQTVWATHIGHDPTQIARAMNIYAAQNTSFRLVDTILGNQEGAPCDEGCRTRRQYSNIANAKIAHELKLVDNLVPTGGPKPNIFIIVLDSVRPDYVGAYNPRADFTPNLDALARDSVVMRRAYANYAGTMLSEPSIWSGALLPHAHYAQPFQKANSLEKLAQCDGYQMVISYDTVLRQLIRPSNDLVLLDADQKQWARFEISSTLKQLEHFLDQRPPGAAPILFYAQPMNVHGHGENDLPKRTSQNWKRREGFDDRIAYAVQQTDQFLGEFVRYLKGKSLYENSIIIITSDHGDATGEFGRLSHSLIIYPEVMRVPLIIHLPRFMETGFVHDENQLSALMDITPSLYYLLGHRPIQVHPLIGRPMFVKARAEFEEYPRSDLLLASDVRAVYGILSGDGRWMYATYDTPSRSMLFDLAQDPNALRDVLTPPAKKQYDDRILQYLHTLADFYGNQPTGSTSPFSSLR